MIKRTMRVPIMSFDCQTQKATFYWKAGEAELLCNYDLAVALMWCMEADTFDRFYKAELAWTDLGICDECRGVHRELVQELKRRQEEAPSLMIAAIGKAIEDHPRIASNAKAMLGWKPNQWLVGRMVAHDKFGIGLVQEANENKLLINFVKYGRKTVVASFVNVLYGDPHTGAVDASEASRPA